MKILLSSHLFSPSVGGTEEVSDLLAHEFVAAGHQVTVVTRTAESADRSFPFEVLRRPRPGELLRLAGWCDVFFHNNISLQSAWPVAFISRPWIVAHHTWLARTDGRVGLRDRLKQWVLHAARNIAVSEAIAAHIEAPATVIGNPYRDNLFRCDPGAERDRDLVCLGRLVSDKGVDLLLQALGRLREKGQRPKLTIVGAGPEEPSLRRLAADLRLEEQVTFGGIVKDAELAALLNRHRIIVTPSRWNEPFGLAPLEGIACGCVALVARCGGLPNAIGPCGVTFERGDAEDLARRLTELLEAKADLTSLRAGAAGHLARHTARAVAAEYLKVFAEETHR